MARTRWGIALLALLAAGAVRAGDLAGIATFTGEPRAPPPLPVVKDQATCGTSVDDESLLVTDGRLANVVVVVQGAPQPPPVRAVLDQRRCRYVPHVQAVPAGSTLDVTSSDPILHSVHGWQGRASRFEAVTPDRGVTVPTKLDRPGTLQIRCDVHGWMSAWVVVTTAPAAVSGGDGAFTIRGLPAGSYQVTAWHERLGERTAQVTVPEQGEARVTFAFGG